MNAIFEHAMCWLDENLISGGTYLTILKGLLVTIRITLSGLALGTFTAIAFYLMRRSKIRIISGTAVLIVEVLRGSPVLLLLMLLYYVVFADCRIDAVLIAILAFGLNSGAHISEIIRSALEAIDRKQVEAARMLGFSGTQAFFSITLPQAGRIARPVYQSAVINLIQWTSVAGYVTITDLTRTLNNIGARTGDPFFSLFLGILIYLGLSYAVYGIFSIRERRSIL